MNYSAPHTAAQVIKKLARIRCRSGNEDAMREALKTVEAATRLEPGCQEFSFFQALSDPTAFVLLEKFDNQAALDTHMALPHTQDLFRAQLVADLDVVELD